MISCGGNSVADHEKFDTIDTGTLIKDVPREKSGEIAFEYSTKDTLEKRIGLHDLSKGYDSIFIRLYYSYSFSNTFRYTISPSICSFFIADKAKSTL